MKRLVLILAAAVTGLAVSDRPARAELPWVVKIDPPWAVDGDPEDPYGTHPDGIGQTPIATTQISAPIVTTSRSPKVTARSAYPWFHWIQRSWRTLWKLV
jgi:hypothetical protein